MANLLLLLGLGLVLEMVNGSWRVGLVFFSGILAGSLSAYCFDPLYGLIGCSGGVYSITVAHLAALILNWNEDTTLIVRRLPYSPQTHKFLAVLSGLGWTNLSTLLTGRDCEPCK